MASGDYISAEYLLCESLFLLREMKIPKEKRIENLRREVQKGIDEIKNNQSKTYNSDELDKLFEEIIERSKKELEDKSKKQSHR